MIEVDAPVGAEAVTDDAPRPRTKARRGFAAMRPELQQRIAAAGGRAAHAKGTAHEFDAEQAREAGRKGGKVCARRRAERAKVG